MKPKIKTKFVIILVLICSISLIFILAQANTPTINIQEGRIIIDEPAQNGSFFISSANISQNETISPVLKTNFAFNSLFIKWQAEQAEMNRDFTIYVRFLNESWSNWLQAQFDDDYNGKDNSPGSVSSQLIPTKLTDSFQYKIIFNSEATKKELRNLEFIYLDTSKGPQSSLKISSKNQGLNIISRQAWGANDKYKYNENGNDLWEEEYYLPKKFIIHHTAGEKANQDAMATVRAIHYWHSIGQGWGDIGYNYLIDSQGNIYEGRQGGDGVVGGHAYMRNRNSIGIAILGCYQDISEENTNANCNTPDQLTEATQNALNKLIAAKAREFNIDPLGTNEFHGKIMPNIIGHSDVGNTVCPGNLIYNELGKTRELAYAYLQDLGGFQKNLPAAAQFVKQSANEITIEETKSKEVFVEFKNTGQAIWRGYEDAGLFLADSKIKNQMAKIGSVSIALSTAKLSPEIAKYKLLNGNVYPGEIGRFKLILTPPDDKQKVTRNFTLAWQNKGYFPETDFSLSITKVPCTTCQASDSQPTTRPVYSASLISSTFPKQMASESLQPVIIRFQNSSNQALAKQNLKLRIIYEKTHISPFRNDSWHSEYAMIPPKEDIIAPSGIATFEFKTKAPAVAIPFPHTITLLHNDQILAQWDEVIEVTSAYAAAISQNTLPIAVKNSWRPKVKLTLANTGSKTWVNPTLKSYDIDGTNSWFKDKSWQDNKTIKSAKTKIAPGESITFEFYIKPYWKANTYPHIYKLFSENQQIDINGKKEFLAYTRVDN